MKRKEFIQLSAFAAAAISLPFLNSCTASKEQAITKPVFLSRLFDEETISNTGKEYIQKTPAENNKEKLIQLLSENSSITKSNNETAIHNYLNEKIKQDFETGKTVLVKGWVLALTEARQCALFWLVKG